MDRPASLSHTTWLSKYHVVFIRKCRRRTLYAQLRRHLGEVFHNLARQKESTFLGANDPYKALKTTIKDEINAEAWASLNSDTSRPFPRPANGRIAVKVINHLGDEVMKVFRVGAA